MYIKQLIGLMGFVFTINDLGQFHQFLGIEFAYQDNGFLLHQTKYAGDLLKKAGMQTCKASTMPIVPYSSANSEVFPSSHIDFRSLVGDLQYLTKTRQGIHG